MRHALFALLLSLLLLGCGGGSTDVEPFDPSGSLSFTYRGAINGSFSAAGELELAAAATYQPVTGAGAYRQQDHLAVVASRLLGGGRLEGFTLLLGDVRRSGSLAIDPTVCMGASMSLCRIGFFLPDFDPAESNGAPDLETLATSSFVLLTGEVTITTITANRMKGTFRGLAVRGGELSARDAITISSGAFDLPLRP